MCGIIGYSGTEKSVPIIIEGLRTLEYRGYDSAGISVYTEDGIKTVKSRGRLSVLEDRLKERADVEGHCAVGHTRWATHGEPSDINSHPHSTDNLTLVHNGIVENYAEIAEMLIGAGYTFVSETDTESAAKLIDMLYLKYNDPVKAISKATNIIRGSYAFGIIFKDFPGTIFSIRKDSPLIVAKDANGGFIASDIPAILKYTRQYYRLEEGIIAKVSAECAKYDANILDISQSVLSEYFAMIMLAQIDKLTIPFSDFVDCLAKIGVDQGLSVNVMHEDIFNTMHHI